VDILVIVTDASRMGLTTVKRIKELSREVGLDFKKIYVVGNKYTPELKEHLDKVAEEIDVEVLGIIPPSDVIAKYNLEGRSLLELPEDTPPVAAVKEMVQKMQLPV
jgi:CO dehydrogenase maturation factor